MRGVTATEEKDSAIRVYFKVKKTGKTAKRQFTAKVKVVEKEPEAPKVTVVKLTGATQKEAKKIAVTFDNKAVTPGAVSAFKVVRTEGNVVIPVKGVVYDDDKTGATIELYNGVTDAKEYTVTYQDTDEAKTESTATFTASDNKVNDIKLSTTSVVAKTTEEVKIKTYDANQVLLNEYTFTQAEANKMSIDVTSPKNTGYRTGDNVYIAEVGDTLTVKVVLHTYDFDEKNNEKNTVERTFDLVGTTEDYAAITYGYSIGGSTPVSFTAASYKQKTSVALSDDDAYVYFNFKKGTVNKNDLFTVESSDNGVAVIVPTKLEDAGNSTPKYGVAIKPVKEGSAYIVVKDANKNIVTTLPFTVGAKSKAGKITISSASVSTSDAQGVEPVDVYVEVEDQYSTKLVIKNLLVEPTNTATAKTGEAIRTVADTGTKKAKITIDGSKCDAGKTISFTYKVTAKTDQGDMVTYLNANILHGSATEVAKSYKLLLSSKSVDMNVAKSDTAFTMQTVTIKVGKYNASGALIGYLDIVDSAAAISCESTDGKSSLEVVSAGAATAKNDTPTTTNTSAAVVIAANSQGAVTNAAARKDASAGKTYKVIAKFEVGGKITTLVDTFDVKDTQGTFTFKIKDNSKAYDAADNIQFFVNGDDITDLCEIEAVDKIGGEKTYTVKSVTVVYKVGDGNAYVFATANPDGGKPVSISVAD